MTRVECFERLCASAFQAELPESVDRIQSPEIELQRLEGDQPAHLGRVRRDDGGAGGRRDGSDEQRQSACARYHHAGDLSGRNDMGGTGTRACDAVGQLGFESINQTASPK